MYGLWWKKKKKIIYGVEMEAFYSVVQIQTTDGLWWRNVHSSTKAKQA